MFNKKVWVMENLKRGFDKGLWAAEHIMEKVSEEVTEGVSNDS